MKTRKTLSILLLTFILLSSFASCGTSSPDETATADTTQDIAVETETETKIEPDLPDISFGGTEINIISREGDVVQYYSNEISTDGEVGEAVNDAIYRRNMTVEDQFDIVICDYPEADPGSVLAKNVVAGDDTYSIVVDRYKSIATMIQKQYLMGFQDIPYVDLAKPWWNESAMNAISLYGENYIGMSDILLNDKQRTYCTIVNKDLLAEYNMDAPYDIAREGKWTLDVMKTMAANVISDLNGDGTMDASDQYGICTEKYCSYVFFMGAGARMTENDADGKPVPVLYNERNVSILDTILQILTDKSMTGLAEEVKNPADGSIYWRLGIDLMSENRTLFVMGVVSWIQDIMQNSDANPGVLPIPKYDESQKNYQTIVQTTQGNGLVVPIILTSEKLEIAGIVLEAMSAYSHEYVLPEYITTTVKSRYAVDMESAEMLGILFDGITYDLGSIYNWGGMLDLLIDDAYQNNSNGIASAYAAKEKGIISAIETAVENYNQ